MYMNDDNWLNSSFLVNIFNELSGVFNDNERITPDNESSNSSNSLNEERERVLRVLQQAKKQLEINSNILIQKAKEISQLKGKINKLNFENSGLKSKVNRLQEINQQLQQELDELKLKQKNSVDNGIPNNSAISNNYLTQHKKLQDENDYLRKRVNELNQEGAYKTDTFKLNAQAKITELTQQVEDLDNKNASLTNELFAQETQIKELLKEAGEMKNKNYTLKSKNQELHLENQALQKLLLQTKDKLVRIMEAFTNGFKGVVTVIKEFEDEAKSEGKKDNNEKT